MRGLDRRNCNSVAHWESKPPKGLVDRRHTVERRKPIVTEATFADFVSHILLMKARK
jgi:hypothetical protein